MNSRSPIFRSTGFPHLSGVAGILCMLAAIWGVAWMACQHRLDQASEAASDDAIAWIEAFEQEISQQVHTVDRMLAMARIAAYRGKGVLELSELVHILGGQHAGLVYQLALIGPDGIVRQSNITADPARVDVSDRPHFRIHRERTEDALFISVPVIGRISGLRTLQLTRRLTAPDGSFDGVAVASVNAEHLIRPFARTMRQGGQLLLLGQDGVLRGSLPALGLSAEAGVQDSIVRQAGKAVLGEARFELGGHRFLGAYRVISGTSLTAVLGFDQAKLKEAARPEQLQIVLAAVALSLVVLGAAALLRQRQLRLLASRQALDESSRLLQLSLQVRGIASFHLDVLRHRLCTGGEMHAMFGLAPGEASAPSPRAWLRLLARGERQKLWQALRQVSHQGCQDLEVALSLQGEGGYRQVSLRARLEHGADGRLVSLAGVILDVTAVHRAEARIAYLAYHDPLTHLPNRLRLREAMEEQLLAGKRFAVLCLDLDRFKDVNDTLGHPVGDQLLCQVARRLRAELSEADMLARLGGDEFCLILKQPGAVETVTELAHRLIGAVSRPYVINEQRIVIGVSIGIAMAPADGRDVDLLLTSADLALYRAKQEGRGRSVFYGPEMSVAAQARRALELDLHRAVAEGEFHLAYQPILDARTRCITGVEALLRWMHPTLGPVSPDRFIPLAEEIGLIVPIGEWVLETACREASQWPDSIRLAINLSALQLDHPRLVATVSDCLRRSGLHPGRLELEITETAMLRDPQAALDVLHRLKSLGLRIAMDDFGTGYSSLGYLQNYPFDKVKIDRSFISHLGIQDKSDAIVSAISAICQGLRITSTAEGVETEEQMAELQRRGITQVQGFLFSRAVPPADLKEMFERLGC